MRGVAIALEEGAGQWRAHSRNTIGYETATVEREPIQASVTATGTLNAVVDVQVGSQLSGNIKALCADFNTKMPKGRPNQTITVGQKRVSKSIQDRLTSLH